jgi:hypothetical protein
MTKESYYDLDDRERSEVDTSLEWLGFPFSDREDIDITDNGEVWKGLTMLCPRDTISHATGENEP